MADSTEVRADSQSVHVGETTGQRMLRWAAPVALVVALVAVVLAVWALAIRSHHTGADALAADSKTRVCTAFDTVSKAVPLQTNIDLGSAPPAQAAAVANGRLALFGGGQYLLNSLDSATPKELADPVRIFAGNLQDIGMNALAGIENSDPDQVFQMAEGDATRNLIIDLCK